MKFTIRHWNRLQFPTKHVLVVEDLLENQRAILAKFATMFPHEGHVQVSVVAGAIAAACIINMVKIDVILLDHDLPEGNGSDLLGWLAEVGKTEIPVITFSGIPQNNENTKALGAHHVFSKPAVLAGEADEILWGIAGRAP